MKKEKIKIGITGLIGSGKSVVSKVFETFKIPVYNADFYAKELINTNPEIINEFKRNFGKNIYLENKINKILLSDMIFKSEKNRILVNSIVHPKVEDHFHEWCDTQESSICAIEAALIYEAGFDKFLDVVIAVESPEDIIIERICKRDGISEEKAKLRVNSQQHNVELSSKSNYKIINDNNKSIILQTKDILNKIM